jgi:hypothetical protein
LGFAIVWIIGEILMSFFPASDFPNAYNAARIASQVGVIGLIGAVIVFVLELRGK